MRIPATLSCEGCEATDSAEIFSDLNSLLALPAPRAPRPSKKPGGRRQDGVKNVLSLCRGVGREAFLPAVLSFVVETRIGLSYLASELWGGSSGRGFLGGGG